MKRIFLLLFLCLSLIAMPLHVLAAPEWPSGISIEAESGILMDADTGTILYGKNMDTAYYPASITKILTALIVLEHCDLDEMVEFSHDDVYNVEPGSSSAGIDEGDVLTVRDCLYALMLASANESANALACHISGSREAFADLMNERAAQLGCTNSHFCNPSGLNDENHYATAHDMALIIREAIKDPDYLEINGTRSYQLAPTKRSPEGGYVANHHKMLMKNDPVYYAGAFAGKTGYTSMSGNTLVTCAERDGVRLIAVVMKSRVTHYSDTKTLLNFGFANFQSLNASDYETNYKSLENDMTIGGMTAQDSITLELSQDETIIIPKEASFSDVTSSLSYDLDDGAPADAIARIQYSYEDRSVGCVHLLYPGLSDAFSAAEAAVAADTVTEGTGAAKEALGAEAGGDGAPVGVTVVDGSAALADATPQAVNIATGADDTQPGTVSMTPGADDTQPGTVNTMPGINNVFAGINFHLPRLQDLSQRLRIAVLAAFMVLLLAVIIIAWRIYRHKKEQADLMQRRQRRRDRLEDMGFSVSEFDRLVAQKRSTSFTAASSPRKHRGRGRKKKLL